MFIILFSINIVGKKLELYLLLLKKRIILLDLIIIFISLLLPFKIYCPFLININLFSILVNPSLSPSIILYLSISILKIFI